uniref:Uncharacterized protein n=1 Tax=Aegilops tauschii subsp. strangulata TaxID=200361 RepID=A0A453HZW7_AEGTS
RLKANFFEREGALSETISLLGTIIHILVDIVHQTMCFLLTVMQIMAAPRYTEAAMVLTVVVLAAAGYLALPIFHLENAMAIKMQVVESNSSALFR